MRRLGQYFRHRLFWLGMLQSQTLPFREVILENTMESPELIQRILFIAPIVLLPLIWILVRFPWRMFLPVWLAGTFVQELLFGLILSGDPLSLRLKMVVYFFPFALFPLGLWSAILAIVGWSIAVELRWPMNLRRRRLMLLGVLIGAMIGIVFSLAVGQVDGLRPVSNSAVTWLVWEAAGAIAGAVDGAIVAAFLPNQDSPQARLWRWAYR
jgi:hypothetical protein